MFLYEENLARNIIWIRIAIQSFYPLIFKPLKSILQNVSQYLFSLALAAFAPTSLAAPITTSLVEREPFPEDIRAAMVAARKDFEELSQRDADDYSRLVAAAEASHSQASDISSDEADPTTLLASAEANHNSQKRDDDGASLLAAAEVSHSSQKRGDDATSLLAAAEANHNCKKRDAEDPATLLAAAEASHGSQVRDTSDETDPAILLAAAAEANPQGESS